MEYYEPVETTPEYEPTPVQSERAAALQRFNRLFVYTPILFAALIGSLIVGLLFWVTLIDPGESSRETVSGIASSVFILAALPMTLLCALPSVLIMAMFVQMREREMAPIKRVQTIFWRLDSLMLRLQTAVNEHTLKAAKAVISAHAVVAYIRNLVNRFINLLKRS